MTEEFELSITDVADALHCTPAEVRLAIAAGDLHPSTANHKFISHRELRRFINLRQLEDLALGNLDVVEPSFELLRPRPGRQDK